MPGADLSPARLRRRARLGVAAIACVAAVACRQKGPPGPAGPGERKSPAAVVDNPAGRAAREDLRRPDKVIAALGLAPGQRVADIGAGHGFFTVRLADAVGSAGRVTATDLDDVALEALRALASTRASIVVRKVTATEPGLEPASYDLVLLSEVDHYLPDRIAFLHKVRAALAPGGRIAVTNRRPLRPPLVAAAEEAGLAVADAPVDLPLHFLVFLTPERPPPR